ncbi:hypothetical protein [Halovenus salina]|uniref:Uncharacterized protein n=1 Tax=Halovenus salina TaxID=1510225 RepID=A0ABD5W6R2_9EURY
MLFEESDTSTAVAQATEPSINDDLLTEPRAATGPREDTLTTPTADTDLRVDPRNDTAVEPDTGARTDQRTGTTTAGDQTVTNRPFERTATRSAVSGGRGGGRGQGQGGRGTGRTTRTRAPFELPELDSDDDGLLLLAGEDVSESWESPIAQADEVVEDVFGDESQDLFDDDPFQGSSFGGSDGFGDEIFEGEF